MVALDDPHHPGAPRVTYAELSAQIADFAAGLAALGLAPGERACLFAEDSSRWLVADQGVIAAGAADAVRGSTAPDAELAYILRHARPSGLIVQDAATLARLAPALAAEGAPALKVVAVLWPPEDGGAPAPASAADSAAASAPPCPVLGFGDVLAAGRARQAAEGRAFAPPPRGRGDAATIVYTSGTTSHPKGVLLTHGNLRSQIDNFPYFLEV